ncbi:unnamed protein product [Coffea canephora]|uniref:Uncharacterized protein n=1 Tax=Coffea canephora TaxID=49390 RepID=A0A068TU68_COFCA|nr:unnamed protein product [Coffea canephora]
MQLTITIRGESIVTKHNSTRPYSYRGEWQRLSGENAAGAKGGKSLQEEGNYLKIYQWTIYKMTMNSAKDN